MENTKLKKLQASSYLSGNASYIESLYDSFLKNPDSVEPHWRTYFENLQESKQGNMDAVPMSQVREYFLELAKKGVTKQEKTAPSTRADEELCLAQAQTKAAQLIN